MSRRAEETIGLPMSEGLLPFKWDQPLTSDFILSKQNREIG